MLREHFRSVRRRSSPTATGASTTASSSRCACRAPSERIDPPLVDLLRRRGRARRARRQPRRGRGDRRRDRGAPARAAASPAARSASSRCCGPEQAKPRSTRGARALRRRRAAGAPLRVRRRARLPGQRARHHVPQSMVVDREDHKALSGNMLRAALQRRRQPRARPHGAGALGAHSRTCPPVDLRVGLLEHFARPLDRAGERGRRTWSTRCESGFERAGVRRAGLARLPRRAAGARRRLPHRPRRRGRRRPPPGDRMRRRRLPRPRPLAGRHGAASACSSAPAGPSGAASRRPGRCIATRCWTSCSSGSPRIGIEPVGALRAAPLLVERRSFTSGAGEAAVDGGKPQTVAAEAPPAAVAPMASNAQEVAVQEAAG